MLVDSPLESIFLNGIQPHLAEEVKIKTQVEIETIRGIFRVDFLIESPDGNVIAIECDGHGYHDYIRDCFRDALILATGKINIIYRVSGHDIYRNRYDHLYWLYKYHPKMFSQSGIKAICCGAQMEPLWEAHFPFTPSSERRYYWGGKYVPEDNDESPEEEIKDVSRFDARLGVNKYHVRPFGIEYYRRVLSEPDKTLDQIVEEYRKQNSVDNS